MGVLQGKNWITWVRHIGLPLALSFSAMMLCAQTSADKAPGQPDSQDACGSNGVHFKVQTNKKQHPTPPAPEGKAMVYVIQDQAVGTTGFAMDGKWIGANDGSSYFFFSVDPGEHRVCSWNTVFGRLFKTPRLDSFNAQPGKVYYFLQTKDPSMYHSKGYILSQADPDEARLLISRSRLATTEVQQR
ncbi:MAG: hypothetical protein ACRD5M_02690 [Candidatus Acidiferrales bacterium]